jgi:GDP-L-fucose synthase
MRILITGGDGYIGRSLFAVFASKYNVIKITRQNFDLTNYSKTCSWFDGKSFDVVIHTAISGGSRLQQDDETVFNKNMSMFNNLVENKHRFSKLISFGSGAELFAQNTPYGMSKKAISEIINNIDNWYNLRIFGVFDDNELNTRFIKGNILRYIKKEPIIIHSNKIMDFMYMQDLVGVVEYYIKNNILQKTINCSYEEKNTLKSIANMINTLGSHKVPTIIETNKELEFYCGNYHGIDIQQIGLYNGIVETYNRLKNVQ